MTEFGRPTSLALLRTGGLLNKSDLAADASISPPTVERYLGLLQVAYQIRLLQPYFVNATKRLVKSPPRVRGGQRRRGVGRQRPGAGARQWPRARTGALLETFALAGHHRPGRALPGRPATSSGAPTRGGGRPGRRTWRCRRGHRGQGLRDPRRARLQRPASFARRLGRALPARHPRRISATSCAWSTTRWRRSLSPRCSGWRRSRREAARGSSAWPSTSDRTPRAGSAARHSPPPSFRRPLRRPSSALVRCREPLACRRSTPACRPRLPAGRSRRRACRRSCRAGPG